MGPVDGLPMPVRTYAPGLYEGPAKKHIEA